MSLKDNSLSPFPMFIWADMDQQAHDVNLRTLEVTTDPNRKGFSKQHQKRSGIGSHNHKTI